MRPALLAALAAAVLAACGGGDEKKPPPSGWIEVAGMICADGTPTGIAISPGSPDAVLVYLAGGGACWASPCDPNTSFRGPFGRSEFDLATAFLVPGTILDRSVPGNPFAAWTIVTVPYCTGDVHAGDAIGEWVTGASTLVWNHHGYRNLEAAVARMAADVPRPAQVVVAGSSAGGFGALLAYDLVRAEWPGDGPDPVTGALLDDSGPTFVGTAMPEGIRSAWWDAWNLASTVSLALHCAGCRDDLSRFWDGLAVRHPGDRLALVSTTRDLTMRSFFGDPSGDFAGPVFEAALRELALKLSRIPDAGTFQVGAATMEQDHALLFEPSFGSLPAITTYTADGTSLLEWLTEMKTPGSAWTSKGPGS